MTKPIGLGVAFAVGFIFALAFFFFNDPDRARFGAIVIWYAVVLVPATLVLCIKSNRMCFSNAVTTLSGIFIGTCLAMLVYYPDRANLWPIAATIWTIIAGIPVVLGSVLGSAIAAMSRKKKQQ